MGILYFSINCNLQNGIKEPENTYNQDIWQKASKTGNTISNNMTTDVDQLLYYTFSMGISNQTGNIDKKTNDINFVVDKQLSVPPEITNARCTNLQAYDKFVSGIPTPTANQTIIQISYRYRNVVSNFYQPEYISKAWCSENISTIKPGIPVIELFEKQPQNITLGIPPSPPSPPSPPGNLSFWGKFPKSEESDEIPDLCELIFNNGK